MSERIDVFISSTSRDLPDHRKQVMDACLRMGMFPIMMEHLPASDADAIEASLKMVDDAEIYLGIFAWRYGYIPAGHEISITEMEYNRAIERGIPRLIFVMHDDHPVKGSDVEKGAGAVKLERFKERLLTEQVINFYQSPEDLRGQVIHSLVPHRVPDPGSLHSRYASEIPLPPEPYIAHPYTLLQTGDLIGRQKELAMLTEWATKSDAPVFNFVVAIGGMGKSALTWKWFNDIAPEVMPDLAGRMWWSFYESDASFENFVIRALAYVSQRSKAEIEEISPSDREAQLLAILDKEPFLLVWDGFERTMIAYARMDAARMADDDLDEKTANFVVDTTGLPESAARSFTGKHQLRKTADQRIGAFLRKLVRLKKSRILVSTRLYPAELQTETGYPLPGSVVYVLRGLEDTDALALWQALGVNGSPDTLLPIFHSFENYPLLVRALAGEIASYRRSPGDFDRWRSDNPDFQPIQLPFMQVKSHVLAFALLGLTPMARRVLNTVAALRMPASYDTLVGLLVEKDKELTEKKLVELLTELEDRGLLGWDKRANRYDLHPIVRRVIWYALDEEQKQATLMALQQYFEAMPQVTDWQQVNNLEQLTTSIELFNAMIGLRRYDEASQLLHDEFSNALLYRLSASQQLAELIECFFTADLTLVPNLSDSDKQAAALNGLAIAYQSLGRPGEAAVLYRRKNEIIDEPHGRMKYVSAGLCNLAETLQHTGELYAAETSARKAIIIGREERNRWREAISQLRLGSIWSARGFAGSYTAFQNALASFIQRGRYQAQGITLTFMAQQEIWVGNFSKAHSLLEKAWELAEIEGRERDFIRILRLRGVLALRLGDLNKAKELLHPTLHRARKVSLVEEELPIMTALAELANYMHERTNTYGLVEDVRDFAERGPYPLFHADALNVLAQIERNEGNIDAAVAAATQAYQKAWCDGPPYAYHWGLEAAKKHLNELGASYPDMPPFDPSKYEPMPEVGINPPDEFHVDE